MLHSAYFYKNTGNLKTFLKIISDYNRKCKVIFIEIVEISRLVIKGTMFDFSICNFHELLRQ
jgi:hypothetical protein